MMTTLSAADDAARAHGRPQADDIRRPPPEGGEQSGKAPFAHEPIQRLFTAAREKSSHLAMHLHPAQAEAVVPAGMAARARMQGSARWSMLLAQSLKVSWPDLRSLRRRTHRIALLPRPAVLQVLAAAALSLRSAAVRRCVGRQARQALIAVVGEAAYRVLLDIPDTGSGATLDPHTLTADRCAAEGYAALRADGLLDCDAACAVIRLSLMPAVAGDTQVSPRATSGRLAPFVDRLDEFFPEQSWLFGLDMDRALSGSMTVSSAAPISRH